MNKFYITTSIVYVNAPPHIGFALELIQADVIARYKRFIKKDVFFLTGVDEHGTKIYKKAKEENKTPQEFVEENTAKYKELIRDLNISNNDFIRTSEKERHFKGVEKMWESLEEAGDIYKKKYKGMYCSGCEVFVREKDLRDGKCLHHNKEPELVEEENYFFRLSKYQEEIKKAIEEDRVKIIPEGRKRETLSFINEGLEDISISRSSKSLTWGIPVKSDKSQTIYVWVDALTNYISALGYGKTEENFKKYWPADVHFVGKDILRFHSCIWIGMLLSAKIELPKKIFVHGFMTVDGKKISKSLGNTIDPFSLIEKYNADAVRYFFLREIPSTNDGDFSNKRLAERYDSDLADGIGNLTARIVSMARKKEILPLKEEKRSVSIIDTEKVKKEVFTYLEEFKFNEALNSIWEVIHFTDKYIEEKRPWEKKEENKERAEELIAILFFLAEILSIFIPKTAEKIKKNLITKEKEILFPKKRA